MSTPINDGGPAFPNDKDAGLTKREHFAIQLMQTKIVGRPIFNWKDEASEAVQAADALIAELNKPNTPSTTD